MSLFSRLNHEGNKKKTIIINPIKNNMIFSKKNKSSKHYRR